MNIYIGNLAIEVTEDELRKEFSVFGEVLSVIIMSDKNIGSGQSRIYGYVEMFSKTEGVTAIAGLEGKILKNRVVCLVEALPLSGKKKPTGLPCRSNRYSKRIVKRKYQIT